MSQFRNLVMSIIRLLGLMVGRLRSSGRPFLVLLLILVTIFLRGQDSVTLEVLDFKIKGKKIKYELLIKETGEIVYSYCECNQKRKKGELVRVAKKDLFFKKD